MNTPRHAFVNAGDIDFRGYTETDRLPVIVREEHKEAVGGNARYGYTEVATVITPDGGSYRILAGLLIEVQS